MKNFFKRFDFRVILAILAAIFCVCILSDLLIFRFTCQDQIEGERNQLKALAQTSALLVDINKLSQVPLNKQGMNTSSYEYVENQLRMIKVANPLIKHIYILKKVNSSNIWQFIVDADPVGDMGQHAYPGDAYNAGRFSEMLRGFNEPAADKKIEKDEWGSFLSGYAPIRNPLGQPMAVLGVDIDEGNVYAIYRHVLREAGMILLTGIIMAILMGLIISHQVVGPVERLITGTRYIADGNFHHRVDVKGDDEIGELANSFNGMAKKLEDSRRKLMDHFYDTVTSLVMVLEVRDRYTLGHSQSVANYAGKIARRMGVDPKTVEMFKKVTLLHDIGKLGVRDNVLLKPDKLTEHEWESIKTHPILGEQILKPILNDPNLLAVIRNHHERQDGTGYPDALSRQEIPLLVSIVTVADSYDAMTSNRSYREAMSRSQAIDQLQKGKGSQFHPDVVDALLDILEEEETAKV